ncbi:MULTISPECIES: helix-turn-helix domain-containing protein [Paenibacillus]|uniref:Transcriptional regulator with XRE-family HTH domain n=1 Tax=Paenibacillus amylolyticus TaxID=1451 RepID=A0AAP5LRF8_PAEAM|nr:MULTISPECIES: helix-turn-helix transcriptional regulator [Paenibacillus]MDR6726528.1 transcriptional regulator with XRE-family HTH domain [Paenibacillus amylolyticus]
MDTANSIRQELMQHMKKNNMNLSQFAEMSGINSGTLSRILHGDRAISMNQLVGITSGMRLPEDYFFDDYIEECFAFSVSIRRIRPFIFRCAELDRLDCIEQAVNRLIDDLSYTTILFDMAEELFKSHKRLAARILYRTVSEAEKYQHSERLARCHYRLFEIELGSDMEQNLLAATQFELYVNRLDEVDQLDAMKKLMHVFGMVHKWEKVDSLGRDMHRIATVQYELNQRSKRKEEVGRRTERPLYYYILYSLLARSTASEECGDYSRALEFTRLYANGESWVHEKDEEAQRIVGQFADWAVANAYLYRLMSGEVHIMDEYVDYITSREDEIFVGVRHIVQIANQYDLNIDHILERFAAYIPNSSERAEIGEYQPAIIEEGYAQFLSDLAVYHFKQSKHPSLAIKHILEGLQVSIRINSGKNIITCMTLFEECRAFASVEEKNEFKKLSGEVHLLNAKKNVVLLASL